MAATKFDGTTLPSVENNGDGTHAPHVRIDGSVTANSSPQSGTLTDRSGTITLGGTAQQLCAANASRKYLLIENLSTGDLYFNFTTTAVVGQPSILLPPRQAFVLENNFLSTELVSIIGATTGQAFSAREG